MTKRTDPYYQAQAILSRRDHTAAELRQKLTRKGFAGADIDAVLAALTVKKLIDDAGFAARYAAAAAEVKLVGPRWVTEKLRQKGVPATVITAVLGEVYSGEKEAAVAQAAAARWRARHAGAADDRTRLYRFLVSRGFSTDAVRAASTA